MKCGFPVDSGTCGVEGNEAADEAARESLGRENVVSAVASSKKD